MGEGSTLVQLNMDWLWWERGGDDRGRQMESCFPHPETWCREPKYSYKRKKLLGVRGRHSLVFSFSLAPADGTSRAECVCSLCFGPFLEFCRCLFHVWTVSHESVSWSAPLFGVSAVLWATSAEWLLKILVVRCSLASRVIVVPGFLVYDNTAGTWNTHYTSVFIVSLSIVCLTTLQFLLHCTSYA